MKMNTTSDARGNLTRAQETVQTILCSTSFAAVDFEGVPLGEPRVMATAEKRLFVASFN